MEVVNIISAGTDAAQSALIQTAEGVNGITFHLTSSGDNLAGAEAVTIEYTSEPEADTPTWKTLIIDAATQQLTVTNNAVTVAGPLVVRANKTATAGSVGVSITYQRPGYR